VESKEKAMTRTWTWRWIAATLLVVALAQPARAQSTLAPLSLTLEDAIRRGVAEAPKLAEARARVNAAEATIDARAADGKPSVTERVGYLRTNHVPPFGIHQPDGSFFAIFPDVPSNYDFRSEMTVPILTSGRTTSAVDGARDDARAAGADAIVAEQDVRLDVTRAYWALVTARANVTVLDETLQRMDSWVGDVRARVDTGILPPSDLLSAQSQRARQNVLLIQARTAASVAEIDLNRLIGEPLDRAIQTATPVDQPLPAADQAVQQSLDALVGRARDSRAERAGLLDRQASWQASADVAQASTRPLVSGVAAVEPSRPNSRFVPRVDEWNTSWDLGVNFIWPLWDGGRARGTRASALAQADAVGHRLEDFDAQVAVEVRQRVLDLQANRAALAASDEAVAAATEARRVLGERFNAGVATATDVLDAQIALLVAELERTQTAANLRLSEARLLRAMGAL
jgi:outer membrane protein TolC